MKNHHIVYEVRLDNKPIYIGSGIIGREAHALSGASHNPKLNEYFFTQKEKMSVVILRENLTKIESLELEKEYIEAIDPECNKIYVNKRVLSKRKQSNKI